MPKRKAVDKPLVKTVVHKKTYSLTQARAKILDSDSESLASSCCGDLSDVESESGDDTDAYDYTSSTASSSTDVRGTMVPVSPASGRWSKHISYSADAFQPFHSPGVRDVPPDFSAESKVLEFLSLFISPDIWIQMTEMTNLRAAHTRHSKPKDYYASQWTDLTVDELKANITNTRRVCRWNMVSSREGLSCILNGNLDSCLTHQVTDTCLPEIVFWRYGSFCISLMKRTKVLTNLINCTKLVH